MNFYSHCWLARHDGADDAFALGAMLPDFAGMSGARVVRVEHREVASGVAHHHAVDAVFHAAPTFVALCQQSAERLDADGVRWGTGRAVAHIGVELLLDGVLLGDEATDTLYLDALRRGRTLGETLHWSRVEAPTRFETLCDRLLALGARREHGEPEVVTERLHRALGSRPRLAILAEDADAVRAEVHRLFPEVHAAAPTLLDEVRVGLERHGRPFGVDLRGGIGDDSASRRRGRAPSRDEPRRGSEVELPPRGSES